MNSVQRKCPYCGGYHYNLWGHVKKVHPDHGSSYRGFLRDYLGLPGVPRCPICGEECSTRGYRFNMTCGKRTCNERNKVNIGTHGLLGKNCAKDENGKMIRVTNSNKSAIQNRSSSCFHKKIQPGRVSKLYILFFKDKEYFKVGKTRDLRSRVKHLIKFGFPVIEAWTWNIEETVLNKIEHSVHFRSSIKHYEDIPRVCDGFQSTGASEYFHLDKLDSILGFIDSEFNDYQVGLSSSKHETIKFDDIV